MPCSAAGEGANSSRSAFSVSVIEPSELPLILIAAFYTLLFVVGSAGNVMVLTCIGVIGQTVTRLRDNVLLYVRVLCVTDLACLLSLPLSTVDMLVGGWIFGPAVCRIYWILESGGKIMATFILTAVSFERYISTCGLASGTTRVVVRKARHAYAIIASTGIVAAALLCPLPLHAHLQTITMSQPFYVEEFKGNVIFAVKKCRVDFSRHMYRVFNIYMCLIGFIIPGILIATFYGRMMCSLRAHHKRMPRSQIPLGVVARYTAAVTTFYFLCLTPYWAAMAFNLFLDWTGLDETLHESRTFIYIMYIVHALPYCNAAFNWVFYAALNSQVRRTYQNAGRVGTSSTMISLNGIAPRNGSTRKRSSESRHLMNGYPMSQPNHQYLQIKCTPAEIVV